MPTLRALHGFLIAWLLVLPVAAEPAAPPAATEQTAAAAVELPEYSVFVAESKVFTLRAQVADKTAEQRARQAGQELALLLREAEVPSIEVVRDGELRSLQAGGKSIVRLTREDAELAGASSLDAHATNVAANITKALEAERKRGRIAKNVFSASLVVFFGLIAFYLARKLGEWATRLGAWVEANGERLAVRVRQVELVRTEMLQSTAMIGVGLARWLGQAGILYGWMVISLSLFDATRGYTQKLTGVVLTPVSALMTRIATTLPMLIVALIAALAVFVLVRFVELLFAGVAKRETTLAWVPHDLAAPTSVLLRVGIVVAALVFAAPVVTGDSEGTLPRVGIVIIAALGIASVPVLATSLVGTATLFGRRLRIGEHIAIGDIEGRIVGLDLMEIRLATEQGRETKVPQLLLLRSPVSKLGVSPRLDVEVVVASTTDPEMVEKTLRAALSSLAEDVTVTLLSADLDGHVYRVGARCTALSDRGKLLRGSIDALRDAGLSLGRKRAPEKAP